MEKDTRRRIQKIKGGSYIITLPPDWIRRNNLDAKSEVFVIEKDGEIIIKPTKNYSDKKSINLDSNDIDTVKYLINVYYMQGIVEILVESKSTISAEIKNELKNLQLYLPGLYVESESFNYIKFRVQDNLTINLIDEMKNFSQKLLTLLEDLEKIVNNPNKEMALDLRNRADDLYKPYNLLIRKIALISQKEEQFLLKGISTRDLILYAIAMRDMGRMLSHIKTASTIITECNESVEELSKLTTIIITMFKEALEVFFDQKLENIKDIREKMRQINKITNNILCKELGKELVRIGSYCIALMDDGVHMSVKL
ncbi:MAG: phosphate uptake regulator PhoU [Saccharolobus sp.]|uniref:AbrB/MazE/SpoVT family DNA-binding domain-containing protein n=1 Tax=Saccharolobus sp. TaxID=2100761 RepID=UPI003166B3DF